MFIFCFPRCGPAPEHCGYTPDPESTFWKNKSHIVDPNLDITIFWQGMARRHRQIKNGDMSSSLFGGWKKTVYQILIKYFFLREEFIHIAILFVNVVFMNIYLIGEISLDCVKAETLFHVLSRYYWSRDLTALPSLHPSPATSDWLWSERFRGWWSDLTLLCGFTLV